MDTFGGYHEFGLAPKVTKTITVYSTVGGPSLDVGVKKTKLHGTCRFYMYVLQENEKLSF